MLNRQNRVQMAVATAVAGGTLAAVTVGAFAATGGSAPRAATCGTGYSASTGYGYGACLPTFIIGTNVIAAGQHTKIVIHGTAGDTVQVQVKGAASTSFTLLASVNINAAGVGSLIISPGTTSQYRLKNSAGTTAAKSLLVKAVQTLVITRVGHTATFRGHVAPSLARRIVTVYDYVKGGHIQVACSTKVVPGGQYKCTHTFAAGTYYTFAQTDADKYNAAGRSPLHKNVF